MSRIQYIYSTKMSKSEFNFVDCALSELEIDFSLFSLACIAELYSLAVVATETATAKATATVCEMVTGMANEMASEAAVQVTETATVMALTPRGATNHRCARALTVFRY